MTQVNKPQADKLIEVRKAKEFLKKTKTTFRHYINQSLLARFNGTKEWDSPIKRPA